MTRLRFIWTVLCVVQNPSILPLPRPMIKRPPKIITTKHSYECITIDNLMHLFS